MQGCKLSCWDRRERNIKKLKLNNHVAQTILEQLGGNKFITMTGAKNFMADENILRFRIGRNSKNINYVKIVLSSFDLYDISFYRITTKKITEKANRYNIYAEDLRKIFTLITGMETIL